MSKESTRKKNIAMAARMKALGIRRTTGKCPICNKEVSLKKLYTHIVSHRG